MSALTARAMSVHRKLAVALSVLTALLALALPGAANAAKTQRKPATQLITVEVPKTNEWRLSISGIFSPQSKHRMVSISAEGPHGLHVGYGVHGRLAPDGTISAQVPGIGVVDLSFRQSGEGRATSEDEGCTNDGPAHYYLGAFQGRIKLDGKGSFGKVERHGAPGTIFESPPETCVVEKHHRHPSGGEVPSGLADSQTLYVARHRQGGSLFFDASAEEPGIGLGGVVPRGVGFSLSYLRSHQGMTTSVTAGVLGKPSQFTVSSPTGTPNEAVVDPPAPFAGSATFKLESSTVADWSGDLRIDLPLLGEVHLTEPSFWSMLCEGLTCTNTAPPGTEVGFLTFGE
jgi:hypothetical protein